MPHFPSRPGTADTDATYPAGQASQQWRRCHERTPPQSDGMSTHGYRQIWMSPPWWWSRPPGKPSAKPSILVSPEESAGAGQTKAETREKLFHLETARCRTQPGRSRGCKLLRLRDDSGGARPALKGSGASEGRQSGDGVWESTSGVLR